MHFQLVEDYRAARENDEQRRDILYGGTIEEWREFTSTMITFKTWLVTNGATQRWRSDE